MNIIVKTYSGKIISRPDTTWEKDNEDFYTPDFVERITLSPVLFAKICKPGRRVGRKFAERYYDSFSYGVLLYPENLIGGEEEDFACASCIDHTSFLPFPLYRKELQGKDTPVFSLFKNGEEIYTGQAPVEDLIKKGISEVTERIQIRTGDLVAFELGPRLPLSDRTSGNIRVSGIYSSDRILDFNIIFE